MPTGTPVARCYRKVLAKNPGNKGKHTMHGLVSLPKGKWIDEILLGKLRELPPQYMIRIDPITLL